MTELQIILLICAVVFVSALYWWGKKNSQQQIQRHFTEESLPSERPAQDDFDVIPVVKEIPAFLKMSPKTEEESKVNPASDAIVKPVSDDQQALTARVEQVEMPFTAHATEDDNVVPYASSVQETTQSSLSQTQLFALLVLSPSRELSRKQVHAAMEASRLSFYQDGTYVHRDTAGNIVFRVANVVEPGFFPSLDDDAFATPGVALVLELPASVTPYRAMDEFITVARKVSQNVGGKLYDAQRHLIKESDLKAMREYAQSLTY